MRVQPFLEELGRRLRAQRRSLGLGVAETAAAAGVSRRTVSEAEAGRANPSVAVLLHLCTALRTTPAVLLDIPLRATPVERVALVGLRGAGKSTVGRALALAREVPFVELDERIERSAGLSLAEVFQLHDRAGFHRFEAAALEQVLAEGERQVIAAGGSIVDDEANFERLRTTCRTVWLQAAPEEHLNRVARQGDARPMQGRPRAMQELRAILVERGERYGLCDERLATDGLEPGEVVRALQERLGAD